MPNNNNVSNNEAEKQGNIISMEMRSSFSGPLPPPQILADYERTMPGAADRIFKLAEAEQRADHKSDVRGSWLGLIAFLAILGLSGFAIYAKRPFEGLIILGLLIIPKLLILKSKKT